MRRISRRSFLASSSALAAVPLLRGGVVHATQPAGVFQHGVASGDPLIDRVILWTRVTPAKPAAVDVQWMVATDPDFKRIVARGSTPTGAARDYTVKVDVTGLDAATTYYYRFEALGARTSSGRTRTLPAGRVGRIRLGVVSCSNLPFGYFNAYARLADRPDLDAVLHLGDYIYEYPNGQFGDGAALGRLPSPDREIIALADYRQRHAQYKADPDSQAVHRQHPFIVVWDDHEFANDTWSGGAENHQPSEGDWFVRRAAAARAYCEWMPIREDAQTRNPRIYRTFAFGDLLDLVMLDTRIIGRDRQVAREDAAGAESPARSLLGRAQEAWLQAELAESKRASTVWQVLGQQVMFAPQSPPGARPGNVDSWDGYRASRDRVFDMVEQLKLENFAVLTGDVHSSWVYDLPRRPFDRYDPGTGRGSLGVEIAGTSVTSSSNIGRDGEQQLADLRAARPHLHYVDGRYRGYVIVDITRDRLQADIYAVSTTADRVAAEKFVTGYVAETGRMHFVEAATPAR